MADPDVTHHLGGPQSRAESWRSVALFVGHRALRGFGMYAVVERGTGAFCGRAGFHEPAGWPGLELGWVLAHGWWGRGYATEAGRALLAHAFETMGVDRVISLVKPGNERSARVERSASGWSAKGRRRCSMRWPTCGPLAPSARVTRRT